MPILPRLAFVITYHSHITTIDPVDDSVLIASQGKEAERRITWALAVSDFKEEAARMRSTMQRKNKWI